MIQSGDLDTCSNPDFIKSLFNTVLLKPSYQKLVNDSEKTEKTNLRLNDILLKNRISCISKDYCEVFRISNVMIWINPDSLTRQHFDHIITIQANMLDTNMNQTRNPITDNSTFREITFDTHNFSIQHCKYATLKPGIIWQEIGRILYYLYDNCKNPEILGNLKDNYAQTLPKHILDITTSPHWQAEQKLKENIERCKIKC